MILKVIQPFLIIMLGVTFFAAFYILSPFHASLLNAYYVPGFVLGAGDREVDAIHLISKNLYSVEGSITHYGIR